MIVTPVPVDKLHVVWPQAKALLERGMWRVAGRYTLADVVDDLLSEQVTLWVAGEDDVRAAVVVRVVKYPRRVFLNIQIVGGEEMVGWGTQMIEALEDYARTQGCDGIEGTGRPGWARKGEPHGYRTAATVVEKDLINAE